MRQCRPPLFSSSNPPLFFVLCDTYFSYLDELGALSEENMSATEGFIDDVSKGLGKFCFEQVSPLIGFACRGFALLLLCC